MKRAIALLGWLGVLLVVAAVVLRFSQPDLIDWSRRLALAGLIVTGIYALTQWRDIIRSLTGRNVQYGSVAAASVAAMLAILVGLNWVANRQNLRWDLTAAGQFSLSDQTRQILTALEEPLTIRVFFVGSDAAYRDQLTEYSYLSSNVSTVYVDANRDPLEAQRLGIETVPTLVLEYAGRSERVSAADEQTVTNALKKIIEGETRTIYFVQGHGERDPLSSESTGYSTAADALRNDNFTVETLVLAQAGAVPADATVVVVAGPQTDLLDPEVDALRAYLDRGGKVHLLLDPPDAVDAPPTPNLLALAREWSIEVGTDLVIDTSGLGQLLGTNAAAPVAMPVPHPITDGFGLMTAFPLTRSVTPVVDDATGRHAQAVLETGPASWAEGDILGVIETGQVEQDPDAGDTPGPITIAAAVAAAAPLAPEAPAADPPGAREAADAPDTGTAADTAPPETRLVVVGDSDFAANNAIGIQGNREIFLNMASWLAQQEDLIAIRPRDPESRPLTMTADQGRMVFWFTMLLVPVLLFANAIRVYWRTR